MRSDPASFVQGLAFGCDTLGFGVPLILGGPLWLLVALAVLLIILVLGELL